MGLWVDIVLIILLFAGAVLYFTAKRQLRQGNRAGWLKWAEPYVNVTRAQSQKTSVPPSENVLAALDDLYREFMEEAVAIREETAVMIDELRKDFEQKLASREPAQSLAVADESFDEEPSTAEEAMVDRRFAILDLLVQGFSAAAIASQLDISVAEVGLVEQLMKQPGGRVTS